MTGPATGAAFFMPDTISAVDGERLVGTAHTAGPWDPHRNMHFGPPAALLGRAIESADGAPGKRVTRVTCEILRPVPIGPVSVRARTIRPGHRVDLVEAVLTDDDGVELALARGWRMRRSHIDGLPAEATATATFGPPPITTSFNDFFALGVDVHYGVSVDAQFVFGGFDEPGPATVWMRMRVPLVEGEEPSPLSRVLVVADSGNGVSSVADFTRLLYINTDLTVSLHRPAVGPWICLDASTTIDGDGSGLTTTRLADGDGEIGTALQTLFVEPRHGSDQ